MELDMGAFLYVFSLSQWGRLVLQSISIINYNCHPIMIFTLCWMLLVVRYMWKLNRQSLIIHILCSSSDSAAIFTQHQCKLLHIFAVRYLAIHASFQENILLCPRSTLLHKIYDKFLWFLQNSQTEKDFLYLLWLRDNRF